GQASSACIRKSIRCTRVWKSSPPAISAPPHFAPGCTANTRAGRLTPVLLLHGPRPIPRQPLAVLRRLDESGVLGVARQVVHRHAAVLHHLLQPFQGLAVLPLAERDEEPNP